MADGSVVGGSRPGGTINLPGVNGPRNPITNGQRGGSFNMPGGAPSRPIIPNAVITDRTGQSSPNALNAMARDPARTQIPVASRESAIGILYGMERLAGQIYVIGTFSSKLYMAQIYCQGEIERIGTNAANDMAGIVVNDLTAPAGIAVHKYLGPASQAAGAVDSFLAAAFTSPAFDEKLPDTAYAVYEITAGAVSRFPRIVAEVKGLKVYDPRSNLMGYSNTFSSWSSGGATLTQNVTGPYGARDYAWTITDSSGAVQQFITRSFTVANDSAKYFVSLKIEGGVRPIVGIDASFTGGTPTGQQFRFNPQTGSFTGGTDVTITRITVGWWMVEFSVTNNSSGNTTLGVGIYAATSAATTGSPGADSVAVTGSNAICEASVRLSTKPRGYIETPGSTAIDQQTVWSDNAALCLGDYLASSTYGEGRTVDAQSLATAADYCDQMMGMSTTAATYVWSSNLVTITSPAHGLIAGLNTVLDFTSGGATPDGNYTVSAATLDTFTVPLTGSGAAGNVNWYAIGFNEKRSRVSLLLDQVQPVRAWRDVLRAYVPCWVNFDGNTAYLRVDGPDSADHTFTSANIDATSGMPTLQRAGVQDTPSVVTIGYTDTTSSPWRLQAAEADGGTSPVRRTRIDLPGIHSRSQALRFAIEKLNHYRLEDLTGEICVFEEGIKIFPGDRATITDDIGITALEVRILGVQDLGHGRWRVRWRKYDSRVYDGSIVAP